jgi:hypothetical protein
MQRLFLRLAGELFRRLPLADVWLFEHPNDSQPDPDPGSPSDLRNWTRHARRWHAFMGRLHPCLFDLLRTDSPGVSYNGQPSAAYPTVAEAHRALSAACVRWGREQAAAGK